MESLKPSNKMLALVMLIPLTIFCKIFQFNVLPSKYFYDSSRMLSMATGNNTMEAWGDAYEIVSELFKKINILGYTSLQDWAYTLAFIFIFIMFFMIIRIESLDNLQLFFVFSSVGLLNIYIFNISKDVIQYGIFFLMYLVIINKKIPKILKVLVCFYIFLGKYIF